MATWPMAPPVGRVCRKTFDQQRRRPTSMRRPTSKADHQVILRRTVTNNCLHSDNSKTFSTISCLWDKKEERTGKRPNDPTRHRPKSMGGQPKGQQCYCLYLNLEPKPSNPTIKVYLNQNSPAQTALVPQWQTLRRASTIKTKGPIAFVTPCFTTQLVDLQLVLSF